MLRLVLVLALSVAFAAPSFARVDTKHEKIVQNGIASMYGGKFVGRTTASGQVLDRHHFTAAHRKLPFGTKLVVTNKRNGRKIIVTVNDRGPHRRGRIIDLSPAAARALHMTRAGLVPVEIRIAQDQSSSDR